MPRNILIVGNGLNLVKDIALRFAQEGDNPIIINTGEKADNMAAFEALGLPPPCTLNGAINFPAHIEEMCAQIKERYGNIDVFIFADTEEARVSFAEVLHRDRLLNSIERNTWPLVEYTKQIHSACGAYPKYVIGISPLLSKESIDELDFAEAAKSLNEVLVKYLNYHLYNENVIFNIVRTRSTTDNLYGQTVAKGLFAMTSGLMDALRGQTIDMTDGASPP